MKRSKGVLAIILAILFLTLGYLSITSSQYLTVSDLKKIKSPKRVIVMGNVTKGSVKFEKELEFKINDGKYEVKVIYPTWILLDNVSGYGRVVVEGIYYPDKNLIKAERIQTSCPSKEEIKAYNISKGVQIARGT